MKDDFYKRKLELLGSISGDASGLFVKHLAKMVEDSTVTQTNLKDKPFNKPYSHAYVGTRETVPVYYWQTYDGCRTFDFDGKVLQVIINDGDAVYGEPVSLRGKWTFEFNVDWETVDVLTKAVDAAWSHFVAEQLHLRETKERLARLEQLSLNLIHHYAKPLKD